MTSGTSQIYHNSRARSATLSMNHSKINVQSIQLQRKRICWRFEMSLRKFVNLRLVPFNSFFSISRIFLCLNLYNHVYSIFDWRWQTFTDFNVHFFVLLRWSGSFHLGSSALLTVTLHRIEWYTRCGILINAIYAKSGLSVMQTLKST